MSKLGTIYAEGPYSRLAVGAIRRGHAVKVVTTQEKSVEECDTLGEESMGIAIHTKEDGDQVSVQVQGQNEDAICGAALAALYTDLAVDAQGRYIAAIAGNIIVGRNLSTTTAADEPFTIELIKNGVAAV